jgi:hypothetical protein
VGEYAVPILPSRNLEETLRFYARLGVESRGAPPEKYGYVVLGRGSTNSSCYIHVSDADNLHAEWERTGVEHDQATGSRLMQPWDTDYGVREFALVDKSGNLVRVGSPLSRARSDGRDRPEQRVQQLVRGGGPSRSGRFDCGVGSTMCGRRRRRSNVVTWGFLCFS